MKKRTVWMIVCALLVSMLAAGCSSNAEDAKQEPSAAPVNEEIVIGTPYGDLCFPNQWEEYLKIDQSKAGDRVEVTFSAKISDQVFPLFAIVIGGDTGDVAGTLTAADGTQRNVYVKICEIVEDGSVSELEQKRMYAMQEDLNYLIDHLK